MTMHRALTGRHSEPASRGFAGDNVAIRTVRPTPEPGAIRLVRAGRPVARSESLGAPQPCPGIDVHFLHTLAALPGGFGGSAGSLSGTAEGNRDRQLMFEVPAGTVWSEAVPLHVPGMQLPCSASRV